MSNNFIREDNKVETSGQSLSEIQEQKVTTVTPFQELPNSLNTTEGTVRPVTSTTKGTVSDVTSTTTGAVSDVTSTTTGAVSDVTSTTTGAVSDVTSTTKGMLNINNLNNNKRIANFRRKLYIIIFVLLVLFVTLIIYLKTKKKKNLNYFRCRYLVYYIIYHIIKNN